MRYTISEESEQMLLTPIGVLHTPFKSRKDAPRQGRKAEVAGEIHVFEEYAQGLMDIECCTHLFVLYWLDRADRGRLTAVPPHDAKMHGVFATRSPDRPNPIALDIVQLLSVDGLLLKVRGLDALDGSPLLDLKPYSSGIDSVEGAGIGWQGD